MNRRVLVLCVTFVSVVVVVGTYLLVSHDKDEDVQGAQKQTAVSFVLPNEKGGEISLDALQGKVKVLNLWASWSPYSEDELESLNRLQSYYGDELAVVALCRDNNPEDGKQYLKDQSFEHVITYVFDENDDYYKKIDGYAVPETLFLNEDNEIVFYQHGPMSYDEMKSQIDTVLTKTW